MKDQNAGLISNPQGSQVEDNNSVGKSVRRIDAVPKVTGRAVYSGDLHMPDMLVGKVLLSSQPLRINQSIDI